jgi:predicted XRE-type DNA-binding protein
MKGEFQSRIAAAFDVNQGRIADVKAGRLHPESLAEAMRRRLAA